jgi:acyl-CoA thioesterase-1
MKNLFRIIALCLCVISLHNYSAYGKDLRIMLYGDGVIAGYGLKAGERLHEQMRDKFRQYGLYPDIINAGIIGDTTKGGRLRLDWHVEEYPDIVVIYLGRNDHLNQIPLYDSYDNLRRIIQRFHLVGSKILLLSVRLPDHHDTEYQKEFEALYPQLAKEMGIDYGDNILEFYHDPNKMLLDVPYPNEEGVRDMNHRLIPNIMNMIGN